MSHQPGTFPPPPPAPPVRRSWWARNWMWFVPVLLICFGVTCIGCCTGIVLMATSSSKTSPAYKDVLAWAQADETLRAQLGAPINATWLSFALTGDSDAVVMLSLQGSQTSGFLTANAQKNAEGIYVPVAPTEIVMASGEQVTLLAEEQATDSRPATTAPAPESGP